MLNQTTLLLSKWECVDHNRLLLSSLTEHTKFNEMNEWMQREHRDSNIEHLKASASQSIRNRKYFDPKFLKVFGSNNV